MSERCLIGYARCDVVEKGMDRGKSGIARANLVLAFGLQVMQKGRHQGRVQLFEAEPGGACAKAILGEAQKKRERELVSGECVRTRAPLALETLGKEGLDEWR